MTTILLVFLLLITILSVVYGRLIIRLWLTNQIAQSTDLALLKSRRKLTNLAVIATALFMVCWLPYCITAAWWCTGARRSVLVAWMEVHALVFVVVYTGISPVLYALYNETINREVLRTCCRSSVRAIVPATQVTLH